MKIYMYVQADNLISGSAAGFFLFLVLPLGRSSPRRLHKFSHFIISIWHSKLVNFIISGSGELEKLLICCISAPLGSRKNKAAPKMTAISRLRNKVKVFNLLCRCTAPHFSLGNSALFTVGSGEREREREREGGSEGEGDTFNWRLINETLLPVAETESPRKSSWENQATRFPQHQHTHTHTHTRCVKMTAALGGEFKIFNN